MSEVPAEDGIYPDVEESAYHQDCGSLSVSGAKLLLPPSCPALFRERMDNPPAPKAVFDFGHLVHKLVLGAGAAVAEVEADDWRSKDARTARDLAYECGQIPALTRDVVTAQAMADAVYAHPIAGPLFDEGRAEQSMYHTDPQTGIRLRGRADWITPNGDLVDYKTSSTANPVELQRKFWQYGYHMQADWYGSLAVACSLSNDPDFLFVVQHKEPPYLVTVIRYDAESLTEGARLNRQAINTYAACQETGVWPGYTDQTVTLSLPYWATRDTIQNDADELIAELEGLTT